MKICFVERTQNYGKWHGLTFLFLSSFIKKNFPGIEVVLADVNFEDPIERIKSEKPDIIGLSSSSEQYPDGIRFAKEIKKISKAPIILGGVHISTLPETLHTIFDVGVIGDGEYTLLELLKHYDKRKNFHGIEYIRGVIFFKNKHLIRTPPRELTNPDTEPLPDYSIINKKYFEKRIIGNSFQKARQAGMIASRGCPFKCAFCASAAFNHKYRSYSAQNILKIIKMLHKDYGIELIWLWDDLFTANLSRLKTLVEMLRNEGLLGKIKYEVFSRVDTFKDDIAKLLKEMDVISIQIGFESGSEPTLKFLKSSTVHVEQNKNAVLVAERNKLRVMANLILGVPGEKLQNMQETYEFACFMKEHGVKDFQLFVLVPFPGTRIWDIAVERGKVKVTKNWENFDESIFSFNNYNNPLLLDDDVPLEEFKKVYKSISKFLSQRLISHMAKRVIADGPQLIYEAVRHPARIKSAVYMALNIKGTGKTEQLDEVMIKSKVYK
jgi:anaerobic magnesium-protoporphyrin IX monomethyl ester cyclase